MKKNGLMRRRKRNKQEKMKVCRCEYGAKECVLKISLPSPLVIEILLLYKSVFKAVY